VHIDTRDGRSFNKQLDFPKGDPRNPLTDSDIEEKFAALADGVLTSAAQKRVQDVVWNLEHVGSVAELMALMEADVRHPRAAKTIGRRRLKMGKRSRVRA
jgi:2-methylcitrate dehydratase